MNKTVAPAAWVQALRTVWQQRLPRERWLLLAGGALLMLVVLWQGAIAPAWSVWQEAPARQARLDTQTRQMLQWQAQAQGLQPMARIGRREAMAQLQTATESLLGPGAQLQPQGEHLLLTLKAAPAAGLAQWLTLARTRAQAQALQAQLQRADATAHHDAEVLWQGTLLLRLP